MPATCTHIAILARDIEASADFYMRYAGLYEVHRRREHDVTVLWLGEKERSEEFVIVLIEAEHADVVQPAPMAHIGYAVESRQAVDDAVELARSENRLTQGPIEGGKVVGYYCIVQDPDGNGVEFSFGQSLGRHIEEGSTW